MKVDPLLGKVTSIVIPEEVEEEEFWRNYFY